MDILVYGKGAGECKSCEAVKTILNDLDFKYKYQDVDFPGFDKRNLVTKIAPGATTVPIVLINGNLIGGQEAFEQWVAAWKADLDKLRSLLKAGETVTVVFTKDNGELRTIHASTNPDYIPDVKRPKKSGTPINADPYLFKVFDLLKQEWRSFKGQRVISIK